jgi:hypothetical protein
MATLPTTRGESPSKTPNINQDGDQDEGGSQDPGATPRSGPPSQPLALPMRPASIHPPSSTGLGDSSTPSLALDPQSSRPSAALVMTIIGLERLDKPVLYRPFGDGDDGEDGFQQLPEDVRQLYHDLLVVSDSRTGIYPAEIRPQVESFPMSKYSAPPDHVFRKPEEGTQDAGKEGGKEEVSFFDYLPLSSLFANRPEIASPQARFALAEFYKLRAIKDVARECQRLRRSEAAWNARVHGPLLELALSRRRGSVEYENTTAARILPSFRPSIFTGEAVPEGQMVNFVIAPRLSPELDAAIKKRMTELSMSARSAALAEDQFHVNQTDYHPLGFSPSAITIVTKGSGGNTEEGRLQLGVWTAAWHKRMEMLGVGGGTETLPLPTLPLILVHEHQWWLYLAVDRLKKIEVRGALWMGSTDDLSHSYQLLTLLGLLGTWVDTVFRGWTTDTFVHQLDVMVDRRRTFAQVWQPSIRGSHPLWRPVPGDSDGAG